MTRLDIGLVDHAFHTAVVIHMAVAVDHGGDGALAPVSPIEVESRASRLDRDQRVDDDEAPVALDKRHVGNVETAHLVNAICHLVQTVVHVEACLTPQAGIDRGGSRLVSQEGILAQAPNHTALGVLNLNIGERGDKPAACVVKILGVAKGQ